MSDVKNQAEADQKAAEEKKLAEDRAQLEKVAAESKPENDKQRRARIRSEIAQLGVEKANIDVRIGDLRAQLAK